MAITSIYSVLLDIPFHKMALMPLTAVYQLPINIGKHLNHQGVQVVGKNQGMSNTFISELKNLSD